MGLAICRIRSLEQSGLDDGVLLPIILPDLATGRPGTSSSRRSRTLRSKRGWTSKTPAP